MPYAFLDKPLQQAQIGEAIGEAYRRQIEQKETFDFRAGRVYYSIDLREICYFRSELRKVFVITTVNNSNTNKTAFIIFPYRSISSIQYFLTRLLCDLLISSSLVYQDNHKKKVLLTLFMYILGMGAEFIVYQGSSRPDSRSKILCSLPFPAQLTADSILCKYREQFQHQQDRIHHIPLSLHQFHTFPQRVKKGLCHHETEGILVLWEDRSSGTGSVAEKASVFEDT